MKSKLTLSSFRLPILTAYIVAFCLSATSTFAIPYCSTTESVNCAKYGIGGKDCHQLDDVRRGEECIDVSSYGMDAIRSYGRDDRRDERRDLSRETCPSGFKQSENKCSSEERRRGCKDIRMPGGLGCVNR